MIDGRLAGVRVKGAGLKENVGARALEPITDIVRVRRVPLERGPMAIQDGNGVQAIRISEPTDAARSHTGQAPAHVITAAHLEFFGDQQTQESAPDISEADDSKVIERDKRLMSKKCLFRFHARTGLKTGHYN